ncbi:signal transduction histidine kinase [Actinoplanes lutulentus]|uniref:histidine kinase n=1 Tax=Actinoplanes lutulentus TaxID=1287878 RepID=A0A327Z051_9ACTN|nr:histidine kinase [Actinoplanes lutulentus]MBB2943617.1 signal transduction histidine kinase [Actinoplanes lutulentus]RAK27482.1 signal transduction histidine kinase [Actinoplanes lutulentus]
MGASLTEYRWLWPSALVADPAGPVAGRRSTRDWAVDTLCFLIGFGFTLLVTGDLLRPDPAVMAGWSSVPSWVIVLDGVLSVIAAIGLWWRRRFLLPLALFALAIAPFSLASGFTLSIVLFTIAVHQRFAILAAYVAATIGTNAIFSMVRPETGAGFWETFGWGTTGLVIVALWGMLVRSRRQLIVSWRERAERAEAEQQLRVAQARVLERTRIAREMHDVLAHRISLLSLHAGALEFRPDAPPDEIAGAAAVVRASANQAMQDLRAVIGVLRTTNSADDQAPERPQPTLSALPALADESRSAGVKVRLNVTAEPDAVPVATGRAAYRIIQEGLTNARKHAPGVSVSVAVRGAAAEGLTVEVRNPMPTVLPGAPKAAVGGPGAAISSGSSHRGPGAGGSGLSGSELSGLMAGGSVPGTGMGLIGLAERATLAGGRLAHGRHGNEFVLSAWLPWAP